ncbi:hypothetical protein GCM10023306_00150 [Novosphingobium ginsenosidimutans]|uniref:Uncharacterized protein n=1 Tax=Novosphingobium ginsenosidimutans TaxID=1176536 RepID=A0A5B8S1J1_9SPHN|nr:hypothetical protein FRF71_03020 [Novosphingobium ginsenosidimutans]
MPIVEAYDDRDALEPLFTAEFEFLPRIGEHLSREVPPGYFVYFKVVEVWHRQVTAGGSFLACMLLELSD